MTEYLMNNPSIEFTKELCSSYFRLMNDDTNAELERIGQWYSRCPTCPSNGPRLEVCPSCRDQMWLANLYGYANLPRDFWRKRWADFDDQPLRRVVEAYRERMDAARDQGVGLLITGPMGTGKTWTGAEILKEACRRGLPGWFTSFWAVKNQPDIEDRWLRSYVLTRMLRAELLVVDDVVLPATEKQREYFTEKLEEVVRSRFHDARPTILTTNVAVSELWDAYPRVMEVLSRNTEVITVAGQNHGVRSFEQRLATMQAGPQPLE